MPGSKDHTSIQGLLGILWTQYTQLVNLLTKLRIGQYRPAAESTANKKLGEQLQRYINHFPATESAVAVSVPDINTKTQKEGDMKIIKPDPGYTPAHRPVFSDHHHIDTVGEKLMQSTWEHLHASIRYAKAGNSESAKLHASIMDSALKESVHFLDDEVYKEFVASLEKELSELTWTGNQENPEKPGTSNLH